VLRRWRFTGRVAVAALACGGCSRSYWRNQADRETYPIIQERIVEPAYSIGRTQVDPDPASRLADPTNPDFPPKPPDDPAAAIFMANPDGHRGSSHWADHGTTDSIEYPGWLQSLGLDEKGTLKIGRDRAVEIALANSRDYQTALEGVYLQALALTLNRFEFAVRWFARTNPTYTHFGTSSFPTETNTLNVNTDVGFARDFAAGGQLLVDFANSFVWEFTGHSQTATGNIGVAFLQPLLRNFGRQVRLESLTQAERDTLYTVRDFARFRKQFWAGIAVQGGGRDASYLTLLLTLQQTRNARINLRAQLENLRFNEEKFRGGKASAVDVDQAYQNLLSARQNVISAETQFQSQLDAFKIQLGLPPRLPMEIDDAFLAQFELTDPKTDALRDALEAFQKARFTELDSVPPAEKLREHFGTLRGLVVRLPTTVDSAAADLNAWADDMAAPPRPGDDPETRARAKRTIEDAQKEIPLTRKTIDDVVGKIDVARAAVTDATRADAYEDLLKQTQNALNVLDTATTIQTQAKIHRIKLPEVALGEADALAYAKEHRLDFQNVTGRVTDAWRKVAVAANALKGDLNVHVQANVATDPFSQNPVAYAASASTVAVGVAFDGPLNRQAERNAYRASLITYQRARRAYMALSDSIEQSIRNDLRQLALQRTSFEISRSQVITNVRRVEAARLAAASPNPPPTAALDIINGLQALLDARNAFVQNYVSYLQQRIQLFLDLEALQLDDRGFPCDLDLFRPGTTGPGADAHPAALPAPRPVVGSYADDAQAAKK
jgi:hypothetical protein